MEYAGNVTQESNEQCKANHYMHIWLVEDVWLIGFAKSQLFPTTKEYILFNYKVGRKTLRMVNPISIPIKNN